MGHDGQNGSVLDSLRSRYVLKLTAIAVVVFVVVGAVGFVTVTGADETVREQTRADLTSMSERQAQDVTQWVAGLKRDTRQLSRTLEDVDEPDAVSGILTSRVQSMTGLSDEVKAIHYVEPGEGTPSVVATSVLDGEVGDPGSLQWAGSIPDNQRVVAVTAPYDSPTIDRQGEDAVAFVSSVLGKERAVVLVVGTDAAAGTLLDTPGTDGHTFVAGPDGTVLLGTAGQYVGRDFDEFGDGGDRLSSIELQGSRSSAYLDGLSVDGDAQATGATRLAAPEWTVAAQQPTASAFAVANSIRTRILLLVGVVAVSFLLVFAIVSRGAIADVRELSEKAKRVAQSQGDAEVDLETSRDDEIGQLVRSVDSMQQSLNEQISERIEELEQLNRQITSAADDQGRVMDECADGDLSRRMDTDTGVDQLDSLAADFNGMMDDLQASIQEALSFSYTVASASEEAAAAANESRDASRRVSEGTQEISHGTDRQSEELETIVQAMSSFSASIEEVASSANQLSTRSNDAADTADEGREAAQDAVEQLETIEDETEEVVESFEALREEAEAIEEIVEFIRDVAEQTNMLALNANIEASRAGEDGSSDGFGVVAGEIKDLARDTQDAAGDIEKRLEAIQTRTRETSENVDDAQAAIEDGTDTIQDALGALDSIAEAVDDVDVSVQEIDEVVENQSETAQKVVTRVEEVSDISEANAQQAENVAAAAEEQTVTVDEISSTVEDLSDQATQLADLLDRFTVGDETGHETPGDLQGASGGHCGTPGGD
jgi:methyl-accepting chemotaxis protein